ncbi:MAG: M48 family metallopeptidase [Limnochordia bacterium]|jgi:predicted metal-dependent hydrolase|nr:M48 family metallopeptidase [Bacillota bacterium]
MVKHSVIYGQNKIFFELERKNVKHINLRIRPDLSIVVSAHTGVPLDLIKDFVKDKGPWLHKNISYFTRFQPQKGNEKEYVSGESFKYLGRQYRLKVQTSNEEQVKYFRGFIHLYVKNTGDFKRKEKLFKDWLLEKANIHFQDSLQRMYKLVSRYQIPKPKIKIREMKARWGSCHRQEQVIVLNLELIKAPKHCIDYVVLHELIHFRYKDHSEGFYTSLTALMPDWQLRKRILDEEIIRDL